MNPRRVATAACASTISKSLATFLLVALATPAFAFDVRPNPNLTSGSVRIDGHHAHSACGLQSPIGLWFVCAARSLRKERTNFR